MFIVRKSTFYNGFNIWQEPRETPMQEGFLIATILFGEGREIKDADEAIALAENILNFLNEKQKHA